MTTPTNIEQREVTGDVNAGGPKERDEITRKDRIGFVAVASLFASAAVAMWLWPDLSTALADADPSGPGGRKVLTWLRLLDLVWSRPLGVACGAFALMGLFAAVAPHRK
jgi:hypothetical protein